MSSSGSSRGLLMLATRQLLTRWEDVRLSWRDQKADEFQSLYLAEISTNLTSALRTLEELEVLLEKIHADCE